MAVIRKLVAVVMADVVGYSRLMERDEAGTHQRLRALNAALVAPKIAEHGGRTVKTAGDGMLLEFPSATAALRCAIEVQRAMAERNRDVAQDDQLRFRIGINLGDIIVEGDDIIGDGVNIAARLESIAEPGGICVASAIREQVHEDLGVAFVDGGEQRVKNIRKPVHVFRVALSPGAARRIAAGPRWRRIAAIGGAVLGVAAVALVAWRALDRAAPPPTATNPAQATLAVLPFRAPADEDLARLAASLSADVTQSLAAIFRETVVVAPEVAASAVAGGGDLREIGRRLGANHLIDGVVAAQGPDAVVTIRLLEAPTAKELGSIRHSLVRGATKADQDLLSWRTRFDARELYRSASPGRGSAPLGAGATPRDMVDRASFLRNFTTPNVAHVPEARKLLDEAIRRDPALVDAYVARADLGLKEFAVAFPGDDERVLAGMEQDTLMAVSLDERNIVAWSMRAWALTLQGRFDAALEAVDRAQRLDPTVGVFARANALSNAGRATEVLALVHERERMLGRPEAIVLKMRCEANLNLGRYREAIADCERAATGVDNPDVPMYLAAAYAQVGDLERARKAKDDLGRLLPSLTISGYEAKFARNAPAWHEQQRAHMYPGLRKAGVPE